MDHTEDIARAAGDVPVGVPGPNQSVPGDGSRIDLPRVLSGLRFLEASAEPAQVFAGLAAVCVPALCDECLVQISEHGRRPYRIRRSWPVITSAPVSADDGAFTGLIQENGIVLDRGAGGPVVQVADRTVVTRFGSPPGGGPEYRGVLICRWTDGHRPDVTEATLAGVLTDYAVALVHRERTASAIACSGGGLHAASTLSGAQRVAAAAGILTALYHLSPAQARQLLHRAGEHTHRPVVDVADTVLRTGGLPDARPGFAAPTTGTIGAGDGDGERGSPPADP